MNPILSEYSVKETYTIIRLSSSYTVDILVDSDVVPIIKKLNWCYDCCKGEVYATDVTRGIPQMLGLSSQRVPLWKYIAFIRYDKVVKAWKQRNTNDYRTHIDGVQHGYLLIETVIPPTPAI